MKTLTTSKVRRATAQQLNNIGNRPDVLPSLSAFPIESIDFTEALEKRNVIALTCGDGCMLFEETEPGCWDSHFLFRPHRSNNLEDARTMITWLLDATNSLGVFGSIDKANVAACRFAQALPAELVREHEGYNGETRCLYGIRREDWPWLTKREQTPT